MLDFDKDNKVRKFYLTQEALNKLLQDNEYLDNKRNKEMIGKDVFMQIEILSKYETLKHKISPETMALYESIECRKERI